MKGIINLSKDTIKELPYLLKSNYPFGTKAKIFLTYFKISLKLFTVHRIRAIRNENILGLDIHTFDYGALHFLFREIFIKNIYFFKTAIKNPLIFDCGANIGMASIYFKWLYPESRIVAFEPDKQSFKLLERNILANKLKEIKLYNLALWDKKQKVKFYVDKKNPGWLTMSIFKKRLPRNKVDVRASTLSSFINKKVDFLKMDIEGAEVKVLKDLEKSGKINYIHKMFIEFHKGIAEEDGLKTIINIFKKNGFGYFLKNENQKELSMQDIEIYADKK